MARLRTKDASWQSVPGNPALRLRYYAATDVGTVRPINEDNFLVKPELGLFAVADGMGGHAAGEVASWITSTQVGTLIEDLGAAASDAVEQTMGLTDPEMSEAGLRQRGDELKYAIWATHGSLRRAMKENPTLDQMGSTLVALLFKDQKVHILNIGDSRAYRYAHKNLEQVTEDHTKERPVERAGVTVMRRYLTRAVGGGKEFTTPDLFLLQTYPGDRFLLCTDGVWGQLTEEEMTGCIRQPDLTIGCEMLIKLAMQRGSKDNLTCLLIELMPPAVAQASESTDELSSVDPTCLTIGEDEHR